MIKRSLLFVFWLQVATAFLVVGQAFILSIGDSTQLGWVSSIKARVIFLDINSKQRLGY
jgi:hypothetical protein